MTRSPTCVTSWWVTTCAAAVALALAVWLPACSEGTNPANCADGRDNDGDGHPDCADPDCAAYCGDDDDDDGDCDAGDCDGDGYTEAEGDCDDGDPSIHPDAAETCDGVDEDCDGAVDEDFDGDGDGYPDATNGACAGAYGADELDCDDDDASVHPGAHEDCTDGVDNDCNGEVDEDVDGDGDGHTSCDGDCDDSDPSVHPGAPETCNDVDDDCDGEVDDGLPTELYYPDLDEDGFGDPDGSPASDCEPPAGYSDNGGDCDDSDPSIHPDAAEVTCDGVDNDCTPATPDDPDGDNDGYGVCSDCDDGEPDNHPGGIEDCGDGIDNDCDGIVDDDDDDCDLFLGQVQAEIFTPQCSICHIPGHGSGLALNAANTYGGTVNVPATQLPTMDRVEPSDLGNSYLWHKVDGTHLAAGGSGAEMPLVGGLSYDQVQLLSGWIEDGAQP